MQQSADLLGFDTANGSLAIDLPLVDHIHGNAHRCRRTALARPRLQHVEAAVFDSELKVLHFGVVGFEGVGVGLKLAVDLGQRLAQRADLLRRADAGHHVFALGVKQVFTEEHRVAVVGVAGEGHARA